MDYQKIDCSCGTVVKPEPEVPSCGSGCVGSGDHTCGPFPPSTGCCTEYYHLPLWKANTVTSWLWGINSAMVKIDSLFHDFALRTKLEDSDFEIVDEVNGLGDRVETLEDNLGSAYSDLANLTGQISSVVAQIELCNNKLATMMYNLNNFEVRLKTTELKGENTDADLSNVNAGLEGLKQAQTEWNTEAGKVHEVLSGQIQSQLEWNKKIETYIEAQKKWNEESGEVHTRLNGQVSTLSQQVADGAERVETIRNDIGQRVNDVVTKLTEMTFKLDKADRDLEALNERVTKLEA